MKTKQVIVVPYDARWPDEFGKIRAELEEAVGDIVIGFEHVGSTSVIGLSAKPIIDIDIVISSYDELGTVIDRLAGIGYRHEGDLGIREREAFKYDGKEHLMKHHLYVCPQNSEELRRHLVFREFLRTHEESVIEYSRVKAEAARLYPADIDRYIEYKSPCIEALYNKCGLI